ncbi:MAG TPA: EAL domain-containing protein [Noviherbaspirillum sp.]
MTDTETTSWPLDGGAMGDRIRSRDWSASPLGPIDAWSHCLRRAVDIMLRMPIAAVLAWGDSGIMFYNDACAPFAETLHAELLGCMLEQCWPDNQEFKQTVRQVLQDGIGLTRTEQEMTLLRHGQPAHAWVDLNYCPVTNTEGRTAGVVAVFVEITERKLAEQALRNNEHRLSAIFSRAQVGLSVISSEGRFLRANDRLCQMLRLPQEKLLTLGVQDVTYPDDIDRTFHAIRQLYETGEPVSIDKRYVRSDGELVHANSSVTLLDEYNGHERTLLAVTVDLTERKRAQDALAESEARFRALADASPVLIWQIDTTGATTYMNARYKDVVGIPPDQLLGYEWKKIFHPDDVERCMEVLNEALRERKPAHRRVRIRCADGQWHWMEGHAAPLLLADGTYVGHVGITIDVNDSVRAQEELLASNERLNLAIEGSGDGVWEWNTENGEVIYSERTKQMLGLLPHERMHRYEEWEARVHPEDVHAVRTALHDCLKGKNPSLSIEYRVRAANNTWRWLLARAIVVRRDGAPVRMAGTLTDVSEKRRSEEVVWRHANFDTLTSLPNRRLFRDRLDHEVRKAHRTGQPLALLFIDLDRFKEANDLLGHDFGDRVLIEAARRIGSCVRQSDTVARLGGDEFTAILTELDDLAHVEPVAQKINAALSAPFRIDNDVVYLSASIGITLYPSDATKAEHLIRNADQAMYVAKNNGRNQFSYFTPSMQREAHQRLRLIADLRRALANGQLHVHYQPVVDLVSGRITKAEALLRWQHPRLGMLESLRFISFAEEAGLITEIGDWVFMEAAHRARLWSERLGMPFQVSVNKSPVQFLSRAKQVDWPAYLHQSGMSGHSVSVEITEGVLLNASPAVVDKLLQYRDAGIQVAIDDFGTGYSSMAYLKRFDIDYLKIDQSFVRDMATSDTDRAIVRSVTAMAHELGMQVIAEGIETPEQKQLLIEAHCDFGQGFLFSKAVPAEEFEQALFA